MTETEAMKIGGHPIAGKASKSWLGLFFCVAVGLCLTVVPASALVVTIDLGWGYPGGGSLSDYNLQEGSIVQVIMFNSATANDPGLLVDDNFEIQGEYTGDPLSAEPYSSGHEVTGDYTTYDPYSVVEPGHVIAYTTHIGPAVDGWWNVYAQFQILGTYDSLYIRVFGATEFPQGGGVLASYWGLSEVQTGTNIIDTWYVGPLDDVEAVHSNYFEVIPEPGTMALFLLGGAGLIGAHRRRRPKSKPS